MTGVRAGGYVPSENEPYMSDSQIHYFKEKLIRRKQALSRKIAETIEKIKTLESVQADILDRSNAYVGLDFEVKTFERCSHMMDQVDRALGRMDQGCFGYCELTGSEIGLGRLEAIPFAAMSVHAVAEAEAGQAFIFPGRLSS
ncbi:MAG: transcriptional regulator, TraR/DksA family protein [Desulfobacter sp.]|nr:MAG: transcriptional regulator, TraR/DksA family protein [Desulfobacter sp.]